MANAFWTIFSRSTCSKSFLKSEQLSVCSKLPSVSNLLVEADYAKKLKAWNEKMIKSIEKSTMYGTHQKETDQILFDDLKTN